MPDSSITYSLKGRLTFSRTGWVILEVPNSIGNGFFQALSEHGVEQPVSGTYGRYNAHVSIMRPEEVESVGGPDMIKARGQMFGFNTGTVREIANPGGWSEISKVWVLEIRSPELMTLRRSLGLGEPKYPFHMTFAVRKKNAFKSAESLIHFDKVAATTTEIKASPIEGRGLFATRDFKIGDTIVPKFMTKSVGADGRTKYDQSEQCRFTNHSSKPACTIEHDGDYVRLVADRDIVKGEELTGNYESCTNILGPDFDYTYRGKPYGGESSTHGSARKPRVEVSEVIISQLRDGASDDSEDSDGLHDGPDSVDHPGDGDDKPVGDHSSGASSVPVGTCSSGAADAGSDHRGGSTEGRELRMGGVGGNDGCERRDQGGQVKRVDGIPQRVVGGTVHAGGNGGFRQWLHSTIGIDAATNGQRMEKLGSSTGSTDTGRGTVSRVDGPASDPPGGVLAVNKNQVDWGERLQKLRKRRGECPGCGQTFKADEPYPDVDMCEVCERFGPPRTKEAEESSKAYKQFRTLPSQPGSLFPLFINKSTPVTLGEWLEAQNHPTPGYAPRPGWHAGALPAAPHLRSKDDRIQPNRVWAEVELPNKVDWQSVADASPTGDVRDKVPTDGHYRKKTPQMQGGEWFIGGSMKVNRQLSDDDVTRILTEAGEHGAAEKERHTELVKAGAALAVQIAQARKDTAEPASEAQARAGNYAKGKFRMHGMVFTLENPKGSVRSGTDPNGKKWSSTMTADYGYINGTIASDEDHIDVFVGPDPESELVFVVDQIDQDTGKFDEIKVMFGYTTEKDATDGYLSNYSKGWKIGEVIPLTVKQFKWWIEHGDTSAEVFGAKIKAASDSIYMNALQQTPVAYNPQAGILGNIGNHLGAVKARGDRTIAEAGSQERLLNAMDPNRAMQQTLAFMRGQSKPLVNHPIDRILAGTR